MAATGDWFLAVDPGAWPIARGVPVLARGGVISRETAERAEASILYTPSMLCAPSRGSEWTGIDSVDAFKHLIESLEDTIENDGDNGKGFIREAVPCMPVPLEMHVA
jgi:hypothetical protein